MRILTSLFEIEYHGTQPIFPSSPSLVSSPTRNHVDSSSHGSCSPPLTASPSHPSLTHRATKGQEFGHPFLSILGNTNLYSLILTPTLTRDSCFYFPVFNTLKTMCFFDELGMIGRRNG